ncbi:hypothetical protein LJ737_18690 [Hymenobacter sp. 15J16-1T3B]|uniref:hypothetical protein n=1 Tax=Hymenobacter sp. 15J16-1T3B TaxID=2886941 RepID=UPI001D0FFE21|nr:hypothetical protein [Hymenobacter sp. 15J16-1T3B]MCC3159277.1 hypothetical protein [Hymenobacter sp. 15J16-1T3B]
MPTPAQNYLTINYDADAAVLTGRWQRMVMPFELARGYDRLLDAAEKHQCRFWLVDTTPRQVGLDAGDVQWMREQFFPQLPKRLGGTTYIALLMAPHQLAGALADPRIADLSHYDRRPYHLARFTSENEARRWLQHCASQDAEVA